MHLLQHDLNLFKTDTVYIFLYTIYK